jgi:hypothetical protein
MLRIKGVIPPLPLYASMALTVAALPLPSVTVVLCDCADGVRCSSFSSDCRKTERSNAATSWLCWQQARFLFWRYWVQIPAGGFHFSLVAPRKCWNNIKFEGKPLPSM